jgi:hypothetical protein
LSHCIYQENAIEIGRGILKANLGFSISQTIIIVGGQQFDKKRITIKIRLVENMER